MKKQIPTAVAALVFACFLLGLAPSMLRTTGLIWANRDTLVGRHGFYFKKRQWLADIRTIMAAFQFLYTAHPSRQTNPLSDGDEPQLRPHGTELSTNLLSMDATELPLPLAGKRLSRTERIMARYRWASNDRLPPMLAFTEISSNGLSGPRFYRLEVAPPFPEPGAGMNFRLSPPTDDTRHNARSSQLDFILVLTNLQGA